MNRSNSIVNELLGLLAMKRREQEKLRQELSEYDTDIAALEGERRKFTTKLKQVRLALGLTQKQVMKATGVPECHLSRAENGHYLWPDAWERLAKFYKVQVEDLKGEVEG